MTRPRNTSSREVLRVENLWFRYPNSEWVLRGVNLVVNRGEIILVVGDTGSGKTSLVRALSGIGVKVYGGEVRGKVSILGAFSGEVSMEEAASHVKVVNQNPYTHFVYPRLGVDLLLYAEEAYGDREKAIREVEGWAAATGAWDILRKTIFEASGGELRRTAIAKASITHPSIILLDEPLMWLDDDSTVKLRELLVELKSKGVSILVFEHRFLPILDLADRVYELRNGVLVRLSKSDLLKRLETFSSSHGVHSSSLSTGKRGITIRLDNVWFKYSGSTRWVLRGAGLGVETGGFAVVYGRNGSGKTTLLRLISGYIKPYRGRVYTSEKPVYVPQVIDLFFTESTISEELRAVCKHSRISNCYSRGIHVLEKLGIKSFEKPPHTLSWGQKVKLAIALSIVAGKSILLLDEPFSGLTYRERYLLTEYLNSVPCTVVVTTSSRDSLEIAIKASKNVAVYSLVDGVLKAEPGFRA